MQMNDSLKPSNLIETVIQKSHKWRDHSGTYPLLSRVRNLKNFLWFGPPDIPPKLQLEWRFVTLRWLAILIIALTLWLFNLSSRQLSGGYSILMVVGAYNIFLQINLNRKAYFLISSYFQIVLDAAFIIGMIILTGGFDTPFYLILFPWTLSAAMRYGYGPVLLMAGLFVAADFVERFATGTWPSLVLFLRSFSLLLTAFAAAYLHEQTRYAEAALEVKLTEAQALNKELEAFSYSVSHDLRAPLRSIDGFSQALLEDYGERLDPEGQDYLERVKAASQRMSHLIDDLLNLSRLSRIDIHRNQVDFSDLVRDITNDLRQLYPQQQVNVIFDGNIKGYADNRLIRIVLENLLQNAWKFTRHAAQPTVEFGLTFAKGDITYYVRDNGVGFDMGYADKLFGAFQRLHAVNEFEGNGIGLATVQRIIHRHGGRVWAKGKIGQGATFFFTL